MSDEKACNHDPKSPNFKPGYECAIEECWEVICNDCAVLTPTFPRMLVCPTHPAVTVETTELPQ